MSDRKFTTKPGPNDRATLPSQRDRGRFIPGAWQSEFNIEGPHDISILPIYQPRYSSTSNDFTNVHPVTSATAYQQQIEEEITDVATVIQLPSNDSTELSYQLIADLSNSSVAQLGEPEVRDFATGHDHEQQDNSENVLVPPARPSSLFLDFKFPLPKEPTPHPLRSHPINMYRHAAVQTPSNSGDEFEVVGNRSGIHYPFNAPAMKGSLTSRFSSKGTQTLEENVDSSLSQQNSKHARRAGTYLSPQAYTYRGTLASSVSQSFSEIRVEQFPDRNAATQTGSIFTPQQHRRCPAMSLPVNGAQRFATSPDLSALDARVPWETPSVRVVKDDTEIDFNAANTLHNSMSADAGSVAKGLNADGPVAGKEGGSGSKLKKQSMPDLKVKGKGKGMGGMFRSVMGKGKEVMAGFAKHMKKGEMPWTQWYCCGHVGGFECDQVNHRVRKTCKNCKHLVCNNCVKGTL